jgi:hypothetical protein
MSASEVIKTEYERFNIVRLNNGLVAYLLGSFTVVTTVTQLLTEAVEEDEEASPDVSVSAETVGRVSPPLDIVNLRYGDPVRIFQQPTLGAGKDATQRTSVGWLVASKRSQGDVEFVRVDAPTDALIPYDHEEDGIEFTVSYDETAHIIFHGAFVECTVLNIDNEGRKVTLLLPELKDGLPQTLIVPRELVFRMTVDVEEYEDEEEVEDEDVNTDDEYAEEEESEGVKALNERLRK